MRSIEKNGSSRTRPTEFVLSIATSDGEFVAHYSEKGLCALSFPSRAKSALQTNRPEIPRQIRQWHAATTAALNRVLAGKAPGTLPPFDISVGTEFQQKVWQ